MWGIPFFTKNEHMVNPSVWVMSLTIINRARTFNESVTFQIYSEKKISKIARPNTNTLCEIINLIIFGLDILLFINALIPSRARNSFSVYQRLFFSIFVVSKKGILLFKISYINYLQIISFGVNIVVIWHRCGHKGFLTP